MKMKLLMNESTMAQAKISFCICVCIWPEKRVWHSLHRRSVPLVCSQNSDATFSTTGGWALLFCVVFKLNCLEPSRQCQVCCVVLASTHSVLLLDCCIFLHLVQCWWMLCCVPPILCLCACPVLVDVGLLWPQFHLSSVMPRDCLVALTPSFFGSPLALWILEYLFVYQLFLLCCVKSESLISVCVLLNISKGIMNPSVE